MSLSRRERQWTPVSSIHGCDGSHQALIEAANLALRYCAETKQFYERKKARTNSIVATKALAHKLARACFHILKEHKPFDVTRCFS
jgi:hypothetical protein